MYVLGVEITFTIESVGIFVSIFITNGYFGSFLGNNILDYMFFEIFVYFACGCIESFKKMERQLVLLHCVLFEKYPRRGKYKIQINT